MTIEELERIVVKCKAGLPTMPKHEFPFAYKLVEAAAAYQNYQEGVKNGTINPDTGRPR